jgi:hypothetical protein
LGVNTSIVELKVIRHVNIPYSGLQVADLIVTGFRGFCELVDIGVGSSELLGCDDGILLHCSSESIGHHSCDFSEFVPAETDEGFS